MDLTLFITILIQIIQLSQQVNGNLKYANRNYLEDGHDQTEPSTPYTKKIQIPEHDGLNEFKRRDYRRNGGLRNDENYNISSEGEHRIAKGPDEIKFERELVIELEEESPESTLIKDKLATIIDSLARLATPKGKEHESNDYYHYPHRGDASSSAERKENFYPGGQIAPQNAQTLGSEKNHDSRNYNVNNLLEYRQNYNMQPNNAGSAISHQVVHRWNVFPSLQVSGYFQPLGSRLGPGMQNSILNAAPTRTCCKSKY